MVLHTHKKREEADIVRLVCFQSRTKEQREKCHFWRLLRCDETVFAANRQEQDGDQYGFCHEAKSFLTFGGVPCRTITPNGIGSH